MKANDSRIGIMTDSLQLKIFVNVYTTAMHLNFRMDFIYFYAAIRQHTLAIKI